jgi:hypothetical protein
MRGWALPKLNFNFQGSIIIISNDFGRPGALFSRSFPVGTVVVKFEFPPKSTIFFENFFAHGRLFSLNCTESLVELWCCLRAPQIHPHVNNMKFEKYHLSGEKRTDRH